MQKVDTKMEDYIVVSTRLRHKYIGCEREETMDDLKGARGGGGARRASIPRKIFRGGGGGGGVAPLTPS